MTKITSFEISKQLKEAGFEAEAEKCWAKIRLSKTEEFILSPLNFKALAYCEEWFPAYDLETILDALPKETEIIISNYTGKRIFYLDSWWRNIRGNEISITVEENESLADTAGRMWLLLKEKGMVC